VACLLLVVALTACGDRASHGPDRQPPSRQPPATARAAPVRAPAAAFAADPALFPRKVEPQAGDWLAAHHEAVETFEQYVEDAPTRPSETRRAIVLQPIGSFPSENRDLIDTLREYLNIYFQLETRVAEPVPLPALGFRARQEGDHAWVQYRTDILTIQVLEPRLPRDAVVYLGITAADLFPAPSWNFVFGVGNLDRRVGVYSLARLGPGFSGAPDAASARTRTLLRALAVLAHETGHMFSLRHCSVYECLMNGVNSLEELDRAKPWLCPDCLRKLHFNTGFDVRRHYEELRAFYVARHLDEPVDWLDHRLVTLGPTGQ